MHQGSDAHALFKLLSQFRDVSQTTNVPPVLIFAMVDKSGSISNAMNLTRIPFSLKLQRAGSVAQSMLVKSNASKQHIF